MPDAFEVLRTDHAEVEQMLAVLENTPGQTAGAGQYGAGGSPGGGPAAGDRLIPA